MRRPEVPHAIALVSAVSAAGVFQALWLMLRYQELIVAGRMLLRLVGVGFLLGGIAAAVLMPLVVVVRRLSPQRQEDGPAATGAAALGLVAALSAMTAGPAVLPGWLSLLLAVGLLVVVVRRARPQPRVAVAAAGLVAAPLALALALPDAGEPPPPEPTAAGTAPDVLLITIDTLRADRLGPWTDGESLTPVLDQLAEEGVAYTRALASSPWTLPSMASLMTGLTAMEHSTGRPLHPAALNLRQPLSASVPTLAEHFTAGGYRTGAIVANVFLSADFGLDRGFQTYRNPLFDRAFAGLLKENALTLAAVRVLPPEIFGDPRAAGMVEQALAWWDDPASAAPRFLWLHLIDPHAPYRADPAHLETLSLLEELSPEQHLQPDGTLVGDHFGAVHGVRSGNLWLQPADRARIVDHYDGAVRYTDAALAPLLDAMRRQEREVLVVVTADHGEEFWEHGGFEHGHDYYAEVTRVPLIFWGSGVDGGREIGEPVGLIDVAPTLRSLAGLPEASGSGVALAGVRAPSEQDLPPRFSENNLYDLPAVLVEDGPWRLILRANGQRDLYDVVADPGELRDLSFERPELTARLGALLEPRMAAFDGTIRPDGDVEGPSMETTEALKMLGYVE